MNWMKCIRVWAWAASVGLALLAWAPCGAQAQVPDDAGDDAFWASVSRCTDGKEVDRGVEIADILSMLSLGQPDAEMEEIQECLERLERGVRRLYGKYVGRARAALVQGDAKEARGYVGKLRELLPELLEIRDLEREIARLEGRAEQAGKQGNREREEHERPALTKGWVFRDCDVCPEMVVVPAESFMMGSPPHEEGREDGEGPVHLVTIAAPFAVGKHEVTRGEFARFIEAARHATGNSCETYGNGAWEGHSERNWRKPGYRQDDRHPVVCVNWDDAKAYVRWLSGETGKDYRLLSESEWEYVARAGTTGPFHFGGTISIGQANYDGFFSYGPRQPSHWGTGRGKTVPVGSFPANGFGLHDMHGNVWEWVEDCWNDSYHGAPADGSAWTSEGDCEERVVRGGSWRFGPHHARSASRLWPRIDPRNTFSGFRVARSLAR